MWFLFRIANHVAQVSPVVDVPVNGILASTILGSSVAFKTKGGGHVGAMTGAIVATSLVVWPAAVKTEAPSGVSVEAGRKPEPRSAGGDGITVRITSAPSTAEVDIDGSYWGTTPTADLTRLPGGAHTIVAKRLGYKPWER